jgi:hypothetical protein
MDTQDQALERQQKALYEEMGRIRLMRRGTLSEQRYPQRQARRNGHGASGPYFLWQGYVQGQRFARRVGAAQARRLKAEIEARQRFEQLCAQYIALGEARAEHQRQRASEEALKKGLKPRSSRARKSRG